jgi:hypothetical protein
MTSRYGGARFGGVNKNILEKNCPDLCDVIYGQGLSFYYYPSGFDFCQLNLFSVWTFQPLFGVLSIFLLKKIRKVSSLMIETGLPYAML